MSTIARGRTGVRAGATLLLALLPVACGTSVPAPSASAAASATQSVAPSASILPRPSVAGSFEELTFRFDLPDTWVFGTAADVAASLDDLHRTDPDAAARLDALLAASALPSSGFVAIEVRSPDSVPPRLSCNTLERGSLAPAATLDAAEAQNVAAVAQLPGIVVPPTHDRLQLPFGETVRVRWQTGTGGAALAAIGYAFVVGPTLYTCVFTAAPEAVARHEPEWEAILATFSADPAWSIGATIEVGIKPFHAIGGFGDIWIANSDGGTISRLSPKTNTVIATIDLRNGRPNGESEGPWALAVAGGRVWVTSIVVGESGETPAGFVWAIDPATSRAVASEPVGPTPLAITAGFGSLWVGSLEGNDVARMDPAKRTVIATIPVGAAPFAIAAGSDSVWVANSVDATVSRIDPTTERVVATIPVGSGKLSAIAVGERGIWVASDDAVRMIDPATNKVAATVRLGGIYDLVASGGSIWGTEGLGTKIHEIDEATATIRTSLALDTNSWGITAFEGSIWVVQPAAAGVAWAERAPGTITRLVP